MRGFLLGLVLLFPLCLSLQAMEEEPKQVLLVTVPKSGTHLLRKAVFLITHHRTRWLTMHAEQIDFLIEHYVHQKVLGVHPFPAFDRFRTHYLDRYAAVLMIRDPRDLMLSFSDHLRRSLGWPLCPRFDLQYYQKLSPDQQLQAVLSFPEECLSPAICFPYVAKWMQEPSVFVCRFEDLIGSRGGGSDARQLEVLNALAQHIGCPRTPEEIQAIAEKLFGGTLTFHLGKIGRWKEGYSADNREMFMRLYGDYLSNWGYGDP